MNGMQHTVEIAPHVLTPIIGLAKFILARKFASYLISGLAIAGLTFGILEIFMHPGLNFDYSTAKMNQSLSKKLKAALTVIIASLLPAIIAVSIAFSVIARGVRRPSVFFSILQTVAIGFALSGILCWITSWTLRPHLDKEEIKGKHFLIIEALNAAIEVIGIYIGSWISRLLMGIINLSIKIVHRPLIMAYAIVAVIVNLVISILILRIMGQSNEAGAANIMGSLIGGIAHAIIRRGKIRELRAAIKKMDKQKANKRSDKHEHYTDRL